MTNNKMTLDEFQQACKTTDCYKPDQRLMCLGFGLGSEVGEVLGKLDKSFRQHGELTEEFHMLTVKEVFDVLWFAVMLADELGFTMSEVAEMGLHKLAERAKQGKICGFGDEREKAK